MTRLFSFSSSLCRDPILLCRDKTSLPCVGIFIAIWKSLSRPCFFVFSLFLFRDIYIPVTTIETSLQLEVCRNIGLFCCNQVNSLSQHHLSRLCFSVKTRNLVFQCHDTHYLVAIGLLLIVSQQVFQVAIISVAIGEILSRHRFCLLFFIMLQHKLICHSSLLVFLFNFLSQHKISMSQQNFCSLLVFNVMIGAFMSRQVLPCIGIQLTNLVVTLSLFVSADL